MHKYYFSFGSGHHDIHGRTLDGYYTIIEAATEDHARQMYARIFGPKWSGTYDERRGPEIVAKYGWEYLAFPYDVDELCSQMPQKDAYKLFGAGAARYPRTQAEAVRIIEQLQEDFNL